MCTAVTYSGKEHYFGRTLDYDFSYGEEVTVTPRNFPLPFRHMDTIATHYAIIGMALVAEDYPLYFDAVNEKGLAMAGLNFVGYAQYSTAQDGKDNIAQFELIPWVLSQCATVSQARKLLEKLCITDTPFSSQLPPAQLHWILADKKEAITIESTNAGLHIYQNSVGVLTNNPPFPQQLLGLADYMHVSAEEPKNLFAPGLELTPYSRGLGAMGLPGDLSSRSRFVRAAFTKLHSLWGDTEESCVSQFFHILETVSQTRGCCRLGENKYEYTLYSSCCSCGKCIYYYTTYENRTVTAVSLHDSDPDGKALIRYPLIRKLKIHQQGCQ